MYKKLGLLAALMLSITISPATKASVYADSLLFIDNLTIAILDTQGNVSGDVTINSFNFDILSTVQLNGMFAAGGASCTQATCPAGPPVLNMLPVIAPGSDVVIVDETYAFHGPNPVDEYAHSDASITTAQLSTGVPTSTNQQAEAQLQGAGSASSNVNIQSLTSFTIAFDIEGDPLLGPLDLLLDFQTLSGELFAHIGAGEVGSAQANVTTSFTLEKNGATDEANWNPQGTLGTNDCTSTILSCVETSDTGDDLNDNRGQSVAGTNSGTLTGDYGIAVGGLTNGSWVLTLVATTSVNITKEVPTPGTLLLLGAGLLGLARARRRKV